MSGGDAGFFESIGAAIKKIPYLLVWSLINWTVGLILSAIENAGSKSKGFGKIATNAIVSVLGFSWKVLTAFVVQEIVIGSKGPFEAISQSSVLLKKTWGERIIKEVGFGVLIISAFVIGAIFFVPMILLVNAMGSLAGVIMLIVLCVLYVVIVSAIFGTAEDVYMTALYLYATTGRIPEGFDKETMTRAYRKEE